MVNTDYDADRIWGDLLQSVNEPALHSVSKEEQELRDKVAALGDAKIQQLQDIPQIPASPSLSAAQPVMRELSEVFKQAAQEIAEKQIDADLDPETVMNNAVQSVAEQKGYTHLQPIIDGLNLGKRLEEFHTAKLSGFKEKIAQHKQNIQHVTNLKTALRPLFDSEEESNAVPENAKKLIETLREQGIDLMPNNALDKATKQELKDLKETIDQTKTDIKFDLEKMLTTDVNTVIQFLNLTADIMKKMLDTDTEGKRRILEKMVR